MALPPADVARRVAPLIAGEAPKQAVPGTLVALSASHFATKAEATDATDQRATVDAVLERVRTLEGPL